MGGSVEPFYATPAAQTVAFGPALNSATFLGAEGTGQLWRAEVVSQPEYGAQIQIEMEPPAAMRTVIAASKEYFGGTPATWSFTVPDLMALAEFAPLAQWMRGPPSVGMVRASGAPMAVLRVERAPWRYISCGSYVLSNP